MPLTDKKIVIVDDSKAMQKLAGHILALEGATTVVAADGLSGLAKVEQEEPDLVLMDVEMPVLDGLTATAIISTSDKTSHIPVVMLTSMDTPFDLAKGRMAGARGYVKKPFNKASLVDELIKHIGRS